MWRIFPAQLLCAFSVVWTFQTPACWSGDGRDGDDEVAGRAVTSDRNLDNPHTNVDNPLPKLDQEIPSSVATQARDYN
jgi:hypothetical protein